MEIVTKGEDIHDHCLGCIKIWKCTVRPHDGESCEIIPCDLDCGARFHACKKEEHRLLCPNERVPCINAEYGCPFVMPRKYLGTHLNTCPASVIYCTMEWNRWPIPASKGQLSQQCHHQVFHKPQLDVALAMRDQRMLRKRWRQSYGSHKASKDDHCTKCSLMLPFPTIMKEPPTWKSTEGVCEAELSQASGQTAQSSEASSNVPSECPDSKSRQQRIFCDEPYRASKKVAETLNATLNMIANHKGDIFQENANSDPSLLFNMDSVEADVLPSEENKENIMDYVNHSTSVNNSTMCNYGVSSEKTNHQSTPMDTSPPAPSDYFGDNSNKYCIENGDFTYEKVIELVCDCDVIFANDTVVSEISSASILDHARKDVNPPIFCPFALSRASGSLWYPSSVPPWCACLGLDLNVESITRYKAQPKSMYTFLCAQEFRRDEYAWHYKNVHSEIHGGLNGWLEERCPLAQYGCTFGRRRFYPAPKGSSVVHNEILESFGVKFPTPVIETSNNRSNSQRLSCSATGTVHQNALISTTFHEANNNCRGFDVNRTEDRKSSINITQLPFEVLQYIAGFLDSFSLCNLSLTSRLLRDVCRSLLEERGIVVFRWERHETSKGITWRVACKRWFFSSSFSPIKQWCFEDGKNLSDHLKTCGYFNRNVKSDPYYFPMGVEPDHHTYQKLKNNPVETTRNSFENITTKL